MGKKGTSELEGCKRKRETERRKEMARELIKQREEGRKAER